MTLKDLTYRDVSMLIGDLVLTHRLEILALQRVIDELKTKMGEARTDSGAPPEVPVPDNGRGVAADAV